MARPPSASYRCVDADRDERFSVAAFIRALFFFQIARLLTLRKARG